jgi:hypothetical protein
MKMPVILSAAKDLAIAMRAYNHPRTIFDARTLFGNVNIGSAMVRSLVVFATRDDMVISLW